MLRGERVAGTPGHPEFNQWPPHCIRGTAECEALPELVAETDSRLEQTTFSAFSGKELADRLKELNAGTLVICGVSTDICVMHTVANARKLGYK